MPVRVVQDRREWKRRDATSTLLRWVAWFIGVAIFAYCWKLMSDKTIWMFVQDSPQQAVDLAQRMVPPKWEYIDVLWRPIWDTINIATLGTAMALVMAVPVAFCAARNTSWTATIALPVQFI